MISLLLKQAMTQMLISWRPARNCLKSSSHANPLEIAELKRRLEPFLLKLPEYRPLAEQLMSSKDNT